MRILVVEDERKLAQVLAAALEAEHYEVVTAATGEDAFFRVSAELFDLVLLDVMLPGRSGFEILQAIRQRHLQTPVLVLTARDAVEDRVHGLDGGADDYLVKPFALPELLARIRALLRRGRPSDVLVDNAIKYSPAGSVIDIEVDRREREAAMSIADRGPGIAPEYRERIFDRFFRVDDARSRAAGGSGLGLAIAKWAVEVNGGRITVVDNPAGGSVFHLVLPLTGQPSGDRSGDHDAPPDPAPTDSGSPSAVKLYKGTGV